LKHSVAATLKDFLNLAASPRVQLPVDDGGLLLDMDTPEDYKRLIISN
jgi:CTP:molybdopterin cytidylyltransferase MocA